MNYAAFFVVALFTSPISIGSSSLFKRQIFRPEDETSNNCPQNWDPSPCVCKDAMGQNKASIYCNNATNGTEIKNAFATLNDSTAFDTFFMNGAPVTSLPAQVFGKASFVNIFFTDTQLSTVDDDAFKGSESTAENFLFERNNFENFNFKSLNGLTNLHNFELSSDKLSSIPADAFGEKPQLEIVNFNGNQIQTLAGNVFSRLPKLRSIQMSQNNLTRLDDFSFSTPATTNPISVLLGHNRISSISKNAFKDLKVATFEFEDNQLDSLDKDVFSPVLDFLQSNNGYISTLGNPFDCDGDKVNWILALPQEKRGRIMGFMCKDGRALQQL